MTLKEYARLVEDALERRLAAPDPADMTAPAVGEAPPLLLEAMRYSVMAGGKRLRPAMLLACADMLGVDRDRAMPYACALEMIHTYSLIHDDLPGMDDDTLRRGRPTNHVVFGVGQAILAGDGLLNEAMETMAGAALSEPTPEGMRQGLGALYEIAACAGIRGMIGGQCADLYAEREKVASGQMLGYIHAGKTARLLTAPLRAAARLAGCADDSAEMQALTAFGEAFGLLFQAEDDILDVTGDAATLGKSTGKDAASGKLTWVTLYGLDGAREHADALRDEAERSLAPLGDRAAFFYDLLRSLRGRRA